jgi:sec-independent protein translocase protein TatB
MFDIGWSELLVIGVVALIVVGPKELPALLRTVGKYVGMMRRQAAEFRAQFDEAMREAEFDQIKKDVEKVKSEAESTFSEATRSVDAEISAARRDLDATAALATADPGAVAPADTTPALDHVNGASVPPPATADSPATRAAAAASASAGEPAKPGA